MTARGLKDIVRNLPDTPGVYMFKDAGGAIIYIGKAKSLKKRVSSYFSRPQNAKGSAMVSCIDTLDVIRAASEAQAQLWEAALIKEKQPRYNISLKDDKSFPFIRITREKFPLVSVCRKQKNASGQCDDAVYYGPYTNSKLLRQALKVIRGVFGFRSCVTLPSRPCLYMRLALCPGPCSGKLKEEKYREVIRKIELLLDSKYDQLAHDLSAEMEQASGQRRFEEAARIRDQIHALSSISKGSDFAGLSAMEDLRELLKMDHPPVRIEAFDIANISGKESTGSMVSFYRAHPDKNNYRRFRIKTVLSVDDYGMIREVVRRRYFRLIREKKPLPDLILIDGGRQHLASAEGELAKLSVRIPVISIAKDRENLYVQGQEQPLQFAQDTPALNLIRRIRDEAHRFAQKYHHLLRKKQLLKDE